MKRFVSIMMVLVLTLACSGIACADGFEDMIDKAELDILDDEYDRAMIACYQLVQRTQPDNEAGYIGEAKVRIALQEYPEALSAIETAIEKNPMSAEAWRIKCKVDILLGDADSFDRDVLFAEVCNADLTDSYSAAAMMYAQHGQFNKAAAFFGKVNIDTLSDEEKEQYRNALIIEGREEEAEKLCPVKVEYRDTSLDAAFEEDRLILEKVDFPEIRANDFDFPDEIWEAMNAEKPDDPYRLLENEIENTEFTWLSVSPSGNSGIITGGSDIGIAYYNGKYLIMYPSVSRGVADENRNLAKYTSQYIWKLIGDEGIQYSPDGRYAAINNYKSAMIMGNSFFDPIIIDLSTGEFILTATYRNKLSQDNAGCVATAAFSSDGRYYYYLIYGNTGEYRTSLYRYDLSNSVTELCYSGNDYAYYPTLSELPDGSFIVPYDRKGTDNYPGIYRYSTDESGIWSGDTLSVDLETKYWNNLRLLASLDSGNIIVFNTAYIAQLSGAYAFQCIEADNEYAGLNRYIVISADRDELLVKDSDGIISDFEEMNSKITETVKAGDVYPYHIIMSVKLSTDGHYLLLYTRKKDSTRHLYLVRLDDLTLREIAGIDPENIYTGSQASYKPDIEWNGDTLLLVTDEGRVAYRFSN